MSYGAATKYMKKSKTFASGTNEISLSNFSEKGERSPDKT